MLLEKHTPRITCTWKEKAAANRTKYNREVRHEELKGTLLQLWLFLKFAPNQTKNQMNHNSRIVQ